MQSDCGSVLQTEPLESAVRLGPTVQQRGESKRPRFGPQH